MGACFNELTLDGKKTIDEVRNIFDRRCEQDGYECGHMYSGSFSEFRGLIFHNKDFNSRDEAYDYLMDAGEKWGPAVCVRHKEYDMPKSVLNHNKQRGKLQQKINLAENAARSARDKARMNNRSKTPAYVTKASNNVEVVRAKVQPKIDERTAKIKIIIENAAAKSNKWVWYLGGWCSY